MVNNNKPVSTGLQPNYCPNCGSGLALLNVIGTGITDNREVVSLSCDCGWNGDIVPFNSRFERKYQFGIRVDTEGTV